MSTINIALKQIPDSHRNPLLNEYNSIVQNYMERRWSPSELSGGRFCEIVYSILLGLSTSSFSSSPKKPKNMETACKSLESQTNLCRSFRILIPRILPVLYEIRNNRNVGHVSGEIDPNQMDSFTVLTLANWIMAEMVRVLHSVSVDEAKQIVDTITERRIPLIWNDNDIKRVLSPKLSIQNQILLLLASNNSESNLNDLYKWCESKDIAYFKKIIRKLHKNRFLEFNDKEGSIKLLPPGNIYTFELIQKLI